MSYFTSSRSPPRPNFETILQFRILREVALLKARNIAMMLNCDDRGQHEWPLPASRPEGSRASDGSRARKAREHIISARRRHSADSNLCCSGHEQIGEGRYSVSKTEGPTSGADLQQRSFHERRRSGQRDAPSDSAESRGLGTKSMRKHVRRRTHERYKLFHLPSQTAVSSIRTIFGYTIP